ncbi:MAG TPA: glycosyltransferase family 4 protein, partial [Oligoflexia bacterium]|nr:glycosyltransferase family 4 protein [Oligoflexia bacterium]
MGDKIKILHLCPGNLFGGVERVLTLFARHPEFFPACQMEFGLCSEGQLKQELTESDALVHNTGQPRLSRPWTVRAARQRLRMLLSSQGPFHAVICHMSWPYIIYGPAARQSRIPVVFYSHNALDRSSILDHLAARYAPDLLIAVSRFVADESLKMIRAAKTEVIYNACPFPAGAPDPQLRRKVRGEYGISSDEVLLIQMSRLDMWKGHRRLLLALYLIRDLRWTCLIAGEPQNDIQIKYLAELRRMVGSLELDGRVRFIGQQKDVRRLLAASDVLCQANEGPEGFSMTFLEALSTGLPIVTTRLGGAPEAIDGTCGLLAPAFDDQEFASALRRIILE